MRAKRHLKYLMKAMGIKDGLKGIRDGGQDSATEYGRKCPYGEKRGLPEGKKTYSAPAVRKTVTLVTERVLLSGSVVTDRTRIESAGQETESRSFDAEGFNHNWE